MNLLAAALHALVATRCLLCAAKRAVIALCAMTVLVVLSVGSPLAHAVVPTINDGATLEPLRDPYPQGIEVQKLYVQLLGRPAEYGALSYYASVLQSGASLVSVANSIASSVEFVGATMGMSVSQKVNYLYLNTFGHSVDAAGLTFWSNEINSGRVTIGGVAIAIAAAPTGTDLIVLNNKVSAATLFSRSLDTFAETNGYVGPLAYAYLASVTDNASLAAATAAGALLSSIETACGLEPSSYDAATGVLTVRGKNFVSLIGPNNDISVSKLTISGDSAPYTLTSSDVEISSATRFSITLNLNDKNALRARLNNNGRNAFTGAAYNLSATEDWAAGASPALNVADLTGNPIIVSNFVFATLCEPGTYSIDGFTPCTVANAGNYVDMPGATMATPCALGSYQPLPGQTSCDLASPGHYVAVLGSVTQTPCSAGSYQPGIGASGCTLASAGSFVALPGATSQTPCALGTTSGIGAVACFGLPLLNIDNSDPGTVYDASTDGVLLLRYLFGLRGAALIANAQGAGASLRDATQIETHLATYITLFDVDGDGKTLPLTDGLMILRRLLNPGTLTTNAAAMSAITAGAKNNPSKTDAAVVEAIDALKP
jgi:Domain of unknown function (DUF4214)